MWKAILTVFRAPSIAEDYNLELQYRKPFAEVWKEEKNHSVFGPLSERMGVRGRDAGPLLVSDEEMEAASTTLHSGLMSSSSNQSLRFLSCLLLLQSLRTTFWSFWRYAIIHLIFKRYPSMFCRFRHGMHISSDTKIQDQHSTVWCQARASANSSAYNPGCLLGQPFLISPSSMRSLLPEGARLYKFCNRKRGHEA